MSKVAVVYWSGTGNTEKLANLIADGAKNSGASVDIFTANDFDESKVDKYDTFAFGCPAMGSEELEDSEFEPMFNSVLPLLSGKKIGLFGSYGWGDGEWMDNWRKTVSDAGAILVAESVICNDAPDDNTAKFAKSLGVTLAE